MNRWLVALAVVGLSIPGTAQAQDKLRYGQIVGSVKSVSSLALYTAHARASWHATTSRSK